jgi:excisionase family DNA binding protein
MAMAAQRRTGAASLLRVQGPAVVSPEQFVERIEARLAEVVVELDAAKAALAELAALACSSPGQEAGRGPQLLTLGQTAALLGLGQSTVHQTIRDERLGSCKIGNSRRIPMTEIEAFVSRLPGQRIGA